MLELDRLYSGYGLASHKGYPTPEHCRTLKELRALPIHRRSFMRVRQVLGLDPVQSELFEIADESLFYDIENVQTHEVKIGNRCHACSFIPLASGRSFLFSIPRADFEKDSRIRINFWWDWQDQDGVFGSREFESWVYFNSANLPKVAQ